MLIEVPARYWPRVVTRWAFYQRAQWWSEARLGEWQDRQLRRLIRHAGAHVPYYRTLFRAIGLDPATFRGRIDLPRIPPLDKETVRTREPELVADNAAGFHATEARTSGSTGTPLRILLSADCKASDAAATLRGYAWAGFRPGMKVLTMRSFMRGWDFAYSMAGRSLNGSTIRLSPESAPRLWAEINRLKPAFFHGYPFALLMLAQYGRAAGVAAHAPRAIIVFGESLPPHLRRQLSQAYGGARVYDFYSMTENAVLAAECPHGSLHVCDDYACHEFVTPDGRPAASGTGEILGTSYSNYAMPLIRYRTRDSAVLPPPSAPACPCGRGFRTIQAIEGRKEDYIRTPDGRSINLFEEPMSAGVGIAASQYVQDAPDRMYVNIVPGADFDPRCLAEVERELRRRVGSAMGIEFRTVRELERRPGESGKTPFLISRIGHSAYTAPAAGHPPEAPPPETP